MEVIPATESNLTDDNIILRVAAYCRVSTYEEAQAGSFELQVQHYKEMIEQNPKWELSGIYADEGVSATSIKIASNACKCNRKFLFYERCSYAM